MCRRHPTTWHVHDRAVHVSNREADPLISLSAPVGSYTIQPTAASTALSVALGRITAFTLASSGL